MTSDEIDAGDDVAAITPTKAVKVAAGFTILGGALSLVLGLQAGAVLGTSGVFHLVEVLFGLLGVLGIVGGYRLSRMRGGSALLSAMVSGLISACALAWFVVALLNGVLVLLALPMMPIGGVGLIAAVSCLKLTERADAARSRLRAQGLDAGI